MEFIKIATVNDFREKNIISYNLIGKCIGVVRKEDGNFFATEVGCKHQRADLTKGEIKGLIVTCHRHGWQYDLESGKCLNHDSADLRKYPLKIENDEIYISLQPLD